jgi:predicted permease
VTEDLKHSLRLLVKNPAFTLVAVVVLALGIGVNTAIFTLVNALLLRPVTGVAADRLVGVYSRDRAKAGAYRAFSYPEYADLRSGSDVFDELMAHNFAMVGLREGDATRRIFADLVSSNYFATLGVHLSAGRAFSPEEEAPGAGIPVVVVSRGFWKKAGSPADLVGRLVRLNGLDFTVVGIAPEGFSGTMALLSPEVWLPLGMYDATLNDFQRRGDHQRLADREHRNLIVVGRLKDGLGVAAAEPRLRATGERLAEAYAAENKDQVLSMAPLARLGVSTKPMSNEGPAAAAGLLMAMAGLVLLIACLNLANMMLARGEARRKEIALRLALGAGRGRVVRQLLTEGMSLALLGGAAGLALAYAATRLLVASLVPLSPLPVVFEARPDVRVVAATLGFCVLATLLSNLGPAFRLARPDVLPELKEHAGEHRPRRRWSLLAPRNLLVVGQVALSLALLATGGLFVRGALAAAEADPGFRLERGLIVEVDPALAGDDEARGRRVYRGVLERLRRVPGVEAVGMASTVPFGPISLSRKVSVPGAADGADGAASGVDAQHVIVGTDYFRSLGLPILRGRDFDAGEESAAPAMASVIVDEPLARRLWTDGDAVGKSIEIAAGSEGGVGERFVVAGVVPGLRHSLFDPASVPHVYVPFGGHYQSGMNLHVRLSAQGRGADAAMLATVRQQLLAAEPRLPVLSARTLRGYRDDSLPLWMVRTGAQLFTLFGAAALFLAVVGVYGVKSYVVARRTREIGIRMALGATRATVLGLVLREGLTLTAVGLAFGVGLALLCGKVVSSLLYQVSPADPPAVAGACALLAASAFVAAYVPARRATRVAPVTALRYE